jgi:hypothetical protein
MYMAICYDNARVHSACVTEPAARVILVGLRVEASLQELPKPEATEVIYCTEINNYVE